MNNPKRPRRIATYDKWKPYRTFYSMRSLHFREANRALLNLSFCHFKRSNNMKRFYLHDDSHVQQYYFDSRLWRLFHEGDRKILDIKCIKGLVLYFILMFKCIVFWMNYVDQEFLIFILWIKSTQKWIWKYIEIIHIWQYRSWLTFQGLH